MNIKKASINELCQLRDVLLHKHHAMMASDEWINCGSKGGIDRWIFHPGDGTISILRAESKINCTAADLFDYLITDIDKTCSEWNDVMYYSGKIKDLGEGFELSRIISEGKLLADREDVFLRCTGKLDNGNLYEVSRGYGTDVEPMMTKNTSYIVRSEMYFASKEFVAIDSSSCLYKTIWHYDPAGWLSKLVPRRILGKLILKNLVHEHQKLAAIFKGIS